MKIANTILEQLGGNKFLVMTGSKNLRGDEVSLTMDLTRNKLSAKWLTITLEQNDTYTMLFRSVRGMDIKVKAEITDVYAEDLQRIFTQETGLYTSLGTMGR